MQGKPKGTLISIVGPTAVGKTTTAIAVAKAFSTEIISCDSRQLFREMKIGTAVPDAEELQEVLHHFIGSHSIHDYYNASRYEHEIHQFISQKIHDLPVMVLSGGSGMYLNAVLYGIDEMPGANHTLRKELDTRLESEGLESLLSELKIRDPQYYSQVDKNNPKRVIRGLEVCLTTGRTFTEFRTNTGKNTPYNTILIGLDRPRKLLYERINKRVDLMMEQGLLEEARSLHPYKGIVPLKTIGYRELFAYFDRIYDLDEAIRRIKANTRKYARKQLSWFRRYKNLTWHHPDDLEKIISHIKSNL